MKARNNINARSSVYICAYNCPPLVFLLLLWQTLGKGNAGNFFLFQHFYLFIYKYFVYLYCHNNNIKIFISMKTNVLKPFAECSDVSTTTTAALNAAISAFIANQDIGMMYYDSIILTKETKLYNYNNMFPFFFCKIMRKLTIL